MKVTTEELGRCEVLMTIEAEPADEQKLLKQAARRISKQVQIPGFRPGKAPYNTVVRRYGLEAIQEEVLNQSIEKIITDALADVELEPQAPLSVDEVGWEPLVIKVKVPGPPIVELADGYRDIRLEAETVEVTDEDVDESLQKMQEQSATWAPVERASELGDLLTASLVQKEGDEILSENESAEYELVMPEKEDKEDESDNKDQPDFITPLVGLSTGDSKTFTINYPEDWQAEKFAGKEVTVDVEVSSVKAKELDPLDDDFAQSVGEFETLDELKDKLRENMIENRQRQNDNELGREVFDKIQEDVVTLAWPEALEEYRLDGELERMDAQLQSSGLTLDSFLSMQSKTKEELREETRERVVDNLKMGLVLDKLSELEQLEVSQMEILERARMMAMYSGQGDQFWQSVLSSREAQATIASELLTDKIFERLAAVAKGEAPEPGAEPEVEEEESASEEEVVDVEAETEAEVEASVDVEVSEEEAADSEEDLSEEATEKSADEEA